MKLDRNTNRGGRGKYALVNMRKMIPLMDAYEGKAPNAEAEALAFAFQLLVQKGIITLGNETPGDQFFVMKYKDKFAAPALQTYAVLVHGEAESLRARDFTSRLRRSKNTHNK